MSAQVTVISTPEIFHSILAELSIRCLLKAKAVCRGWCDAINASSTIQQKLFFQPIPETTTPRRKLKLNLILSEVFRPWFEPDRFPQQATDTMAIHVFDKLQIDRYRHAFLRQGATWRHMLVQQPPALELGILDIHRRFDTTEFTKHRASFEENMGLRMGPLYDLVQEWLGTTRHYCQLVWWRLPDLQLLEKEQIRDVIKQMLEDVDVVLQRQIIGAIPMQPSPMNFEWRHKFKSEDYDVVDVVSDEESE